MNEAEDRHIPLLQLVGATKNLRAANTILAAHLQASSAWQEVVLQAKPQAFDVPTFGQVTQTKAAGWHWIAPHSWHVLATLIIETNFILTLSCRLAHCSAGKYAPEYSWQQAQTPYCHDYWQNGMWVNGGPNQACYCPDSDWKNMDVIPDVGKALDLAASGSTPAARQAGRVAGVTRMLYGTIPSTWGRMANGSLAAWSSKLISV
jgi:hypothetical protein